MRERDKPLPCILETCQGNFDLSGVSYKWNQHVRNSHNLIQGLWYRYFHQYSTWRLVFSFIHYHFLLMFLCLSPTSRTYRSFNWDLVCLINYSIFGAYGEFQVQLKKYLLISRVTLHIQRHLLCHHPWLFF